ncbi:MULTISPECIES: porin [Pusillimonas]|uniref:porin n=1 Tax=Pusillimonas TaxID=305976 RepID=UPI000E59BFA5|nr:MULTISPECIES: porin [Pusillimonas]MDX3894503.1 porin [Pusillimonas sp.]TFL09418.1 porin [Pusillimonas caeni]
MKHVKKAGLVAVAAALGLPWAVQAETSVTMYGKLYPEIVYGKVSGASDAGTSSLSNQTRLPNADYSGTGMASSNSKFGLKGSEDLGGNLKAIFQLEMNVGVHDGSGGSSSSMWNRNTFVGLKGDLGTIKFGQMDTPYKEVGDTLSFLGVSSGNFVANSTILSKHAFGTSSASSFHLRRSNAITYESPKLNGFQFLAQYSKNTPDFTADDPKPWVFSTGVLYEQGPLYLALAYEYHKDLYGGSRNMPTAAQRDLAGKEAKDSAVRLTAGYRFTKNTRAEANFAHLRLKESGGPAGDFESYRHNTWSLNVQHKIGATTLQASYAQATAGSCTLVGDVECSTSGLQGRQFNIGASYALSKRTYLFAIASKLINGESARFNNLSLDGDISPGADITQVAVGLAHSF